MLSEPVAVPALLPPAAVAVTCAAFAPPGAVGNRGPVEVTIAVLSWKQNPFNIDVAQGAPAVSEQSDTTAADTEFTAAPKLLHTQFQLLHPTSSNARVTPEHESMHFGQLLRSLKPGYWVMSVYSELIIARGANNSRNLIGVIRRSIV